MREQQRIFLEGNQRFPEFIDIGISGKACSTGTSAISSR